MTGPITPPPELVRHWSRFQGDTDPEALWFRIANEAAQWGANQELEACCEYVYERLKVTTAACIAQELRDARRPNPPSLKEKALDALKHAPGPDYPNPITLLTADEHALIRRALEALPE
jgi:hypothetical protein